MDHPFHHTWPMLNSDNPNYAKRTFPIVYSLKFLFCYSLLTILLTLGNSVGQTSKISEVIHQKARNKESHK